MSFPAGIASGFEKAFILGGHAVFTIENVETDNRFTYKVEQAKAREGETRPSPWFVSVLTGPDNTSDYTYAGMITAGDQKFVRTKGSKLSPEAQSYRVFAWVWARIDRLPGNVLICHSGRCSRCGRLLTDPESIETGIGPTCARKAERAA